MNAQYFINKFEAIPEEEWTIGTQQDVSGKRCALGHCMPKEEKLKGGMDFTGWGHETREGQALKNLFKEHLVFWDVPTVNNHRTTRFSQDTPKQRILAALNHILLLEEQEKALKQTKEVLAQSLELV